MAIRGSAPRGHREQERRSSRWATDRHEWICWSRITGLEFSCQQHTICVRQNTDVLTLNPRLTDCSYSHCLIELPLGFQQLRFCTFVETLWKISKKMNPMKCWANWIPLRICVRVHNITLYEYWWIDLDSSQNSIWDCYGSFDDQRLFSVKSVRFRNFFDFAQIWGTLESDKLWEIHCWRVADGKDESW